MAHRDVIVVGASAGGLEPLRELVKGLPRDLPAALLVVLHIPAYGPSLLPEILTKAGTLPVHHPTDGDSILSGHVYVAPPDHHLMVEDGVVRVTKGPRENRFRPSVDVLFRSAGLAYGPRAIGVLLSGALDDGTSGLWAIKQRGGVVVVQEPSEADHPSMPLSALREVEVDHTVPVAEMPALLMRLVREPVADAPAMTEEARARIALEVSLARGSAQVEGDMTELGKLSPFTCPECYGALIEVDEAGPLRFRCYTGHSFTASALLIAISESLESSLWQAIRALEETAMLLEHLGEHLKDAGQTGDADAFSDKAGQFRTRARRIKDAAFRHDHMTDVVSSDELGSSNG